MLYNSNQSQKVAASSSLSTLPEASRIVPDFTISVYDSSCNYLFISLILTTLPSLSIFFFISNAGCLDIGEGSKKENKTKKGESHEMLYTEMIKSGTEVTERYNNRNLPEQSHCICTLPQLVMHFLTRQGSADYGENINMAGQAASKSYLHSMLTGRLVLAEIRLISSAIGQPEKKDAFCSCSLLSDPH